MLISDDRRNFKLPLLAKTQILIIGMHLPEYFEPLSTQLPRYFPNVKTMLVARLRTNCESARMCACHWSYTCPSRIVLDPEHFVFRNTGSEGLQMPEGWSKWWSANPTATVKMVTIVLSPVGGSVTIPIPADRGSDISEDLGRSLPHVGRIRFVFSYDEGTDNATDPMDSVVEQTTWLPGTAIEDRSSVDMQVLSVFFKPLLSQQGIQYEICGGEILGKQGLNPKWTTEMVKLLVEQYQETRPDYTGDNIIIMTRKEWKATKEAKWEMGLRKLEGEDKLDLIAEEQLGRVQQGASVSSEM